MSDKRCQTCFNLTAYCTCNHVRGLDAIINSSTDGIDHSTPTSWWTDWLNQGTTTLTYEQLERCFYPEGTPESRHPSAAPPRHLHAVPDESDDAGVKKP